MSTTALLPCSSVCLRNSALISSHDVPISPPQLSMPPAKKKASKAAPASPAVAPAPAPAAAASAPAAAAPAVAAASAPSTYTPGDLTRLFNPSLKDADATTVAQTSVAAPAPTPAEIAAAKAAAKAARSAARAAAAAAPAAPKQPAAAPAAAAGVSEAARKALSVAAALMRDKRRQFEARGDVLPAGADQAVLAAAGAEVVDMSMPIMRSVPGKKAVEKGAKKTDDASADDGSEEEGESAEATKAPKLTKSAAKIAARKAAAAAAAAAAEEADASSDDDIVAAASAWRKEGDITESDDDNDDDDDDDDGADAEDAKAAAERRGLAALARVAAGTDRGTIAPTIANLRAMDVKFAEVDGDSDEEIEAEEAKKAALAATPRYKAKDDPRNPRTVFLGNVPKIATEKDVRRFLASAGPVESVRFRSVAFATPGMPKRWAFAKRMLHDARESMNAYAVMEKEEDAKKAADTLNGALMTVVPGKAARAAAKTAAKAEGKDVEAALAAVGTEPISLHVRVDLASGNGRADAFRSVFLGGLSFAANEEQVRSFFASCGDVESVRLVRDKKINVGKGIGFVTFKNRFSVAEALKLSGKKLLDRAVRITKVTVGGTSVGSFAVAKARRDLETRNERKAFSAGKRAHAAAAAAGGSDDDGADDDGEETGAALRVKRARIHNTGKVQGAFHKAFASGATLAAGGKLKKPRHVPRPSSGKIGGVLRPQAWMGQIAKVGDTLGRASKGRREAAAGKK